MLSMQSKHYADGTMWWNKLNTMSDAEFKMMPYGFVKKYGSIIHFLKRQREEHHLSENQNLNNYYSEVKHLQKLMTDQEKADADKKFQTDQVIKKVDIAELIREDGDYMKR